MANWKWTIDLSDIHNSYREGEYDDPNEIARKVVVRIKSSTSYNDPTNKEILDHICTAFESVEDIEQYGLTLGILYDWGDYDKTCWIATESWMVNK